MCCSTLESAGCEDLGRHQLLPWRNRHVDAVADEIMEGAADFLHRQWLRIAAAGGAEAAAKS